MHTLKLAEAIKDYGKDIRLNLSSVLSEEGSPGLTLQQIWGIALASTFSIKNAKLLEAVAADATEKLPVEFLEAAKAASTVMAMNNVYYRTTHLAEDKTFSKMPARLRMNVIGRPGIEKKDFELMCLAISALAGCGACINAHIHEATKAEISNEGIQSSFRIASVLNAAAQALTIN